MKSLLRTYLFHLVALVAATFILQEGLKFAADPRTWAMAGGILALLNLLLKPILNILFLPIRALTLGLFSIVINAFVFYLFIRLVPQITIAPWHFPGFSWQTITIAAYEVPWWGTLLVASSIISLITNFLGYLVE